MKNKILRKVTCLFATVSLLCCVGCKDDNGGKDDSSSFKPTQIAQAESFIKFGQKTLELSVGENFDLQVFSSASVDAIDWTTSNQEVATVKQGKIVAVQVGKATITASLGEFDKAVCEVTVSAGVSMAYSLKISREELRLNVGETFLIDSEVKYGSDLVSGVSMIWSSSNAAVASVDNQGKVTPHAYGTAKITAKCILADGTALEKVCNVSVIENFVLKLSEAETGIFVKPGDTFSVTPKLYAENGNEIIVDESACTYGVVNQRFVEEENGEFKAVSTGKTQVYVEYRGIVAYCNVDVWGISAENFSVVNGMPGSSVTQERHGALVYTGISGVSKENVCGVLGPDWKNFVSEAIGYGYTSVVVKVYQVDGVLMLYPDGVANSLFDVERGASLTANDVSFEKPYVSEKSLSECQDWAGVYFAMYGNGSFVFEITVK